MQRGAFSIAARSLAGLSYALHVANVLFINQFPDYRADAAAGKRNWVVRLGPQRARWGYLLAVLAAYLWLIAAVAFRLAALAGLAGARRRDSRAQGGAGTAAHAANPQGLVPAIKATIGAAMMHGVLLAVGLSAARLLGS
ncbi:MAG: UbiA family prenyltransferase [Comamonadaceae bacterium]|nr:UbiA family prenyltransferase [Comamonadaceae bacterium]